MNKLYKCFGLIKNSTFVFAGAQIVTILLPARWQLTCELVLKGLHVIYLLNRRIFSIFMYAIYHTKKFDKEFYKRLSKEEQAEVENFEKKQLVNNPYVGDPISYPFFREKKVWNKRIYYLIYDELKAVLVVGISDKKAQQETIDAIKDKLKEYYEIIKDSIKQRA